MIHSRLVTFIVLIVAAIVSAWSAYLVWFRPDLFRERFSKVFGSDSGKRHARSAFVLWLWRLNTTLATILTIILLLTACWQLILEILS